MLKLTFLVSPPSGASLQQWPARMGTCAAINERAQVRNPQGNVAYLRQLVI